MTEDFQLSLDTCAREPIHIPGAIQPHGMLLVCGRDGLPIRQVSANAAAWLGYEASALLDTAFFALLVPASAAQLADALGHAVLREVSPLRLTLATGGALDALLHRVDDRVIIELERPGEAPLSGPRGFDPRLRGSILRMQHAASMTELFDVAADEVRTVTGFDRVMAYRFDDEWNGEVVAERKRADLAPFLGQHYPAADIPVQARRLYTINWLRLIADVNYAPVPLVPVLDPVTRAPCDLSHAVLRSVSPIHIEYLRNMGVTASMSVSLLVDGQLAGLIACHHYAGPRVIDAAGRDTAEFLGQSLSWQLRVLETALDAQRRQHVQHQEAELVRAMAGAADLLTGLAPAPLLALTDATGAAVVLEDGQRVFGDVPAPGQLTALVRWLRDRPDDVFVTTHLANEFAPAAGGAIAGLLAVTISRELGEYLMWFRPSTERTIDWAGDPNKVVVIENDTGAPRLSPRGSFAVWREVVKGRALPWRPWQVEAASNFRRVLLGGFRKRSVELRQLNARLLETDRIKDAFIATVSHELRTPLNAISGWTEMLQGGNLPVERTAHALEVIARNARAQKQIVDDLLDVSRIASGKIALDITSVDLPGLIDSVLDGSMLAIQAKGLRLKRVLDPSATPVLGDVARLRQVVNNLLTNAIKFTPKDGAITVFLRRLSSDVELMVQDSGKGIAPAFLPHVFEAFRQQDEAMNRRTQGLGLGLAIARKLVELHGGRIEAESEGEGRGAMFRVRLPMAPLRAHAGDHAGAEHAFVARGELAGVRVLIVEDEDDARELLVALLGQCGAEISVASSAQAALAVIAARPLDVIVSDIGMPDTDGLELLRAVRALPGPERTTPAIALTAYTRAVDRTKALQAGFQAHVPKPVDAQELVTVISSVVGRL